MPNVRIAPILDSCRRAGLGVARYFGTSIALAASLVLTAASPSAGEGVRDRYDGELRRWELSGAAEFGVYARTAKGSASGSLLVGPRAANANVEPNKDGPDTVIDPVEGENDLYSLLMGGVFSVMTPSLLDVPTQPRLFVDLGILAASTLESPVARQGDPGRFALPFANVNVPVINEPQVIGSGTEVSSQEQDYQLQLGLGAAFTFDLEESRIRIKPSFRYSRSQNMVSGVVHRAVRLVLSDPIIPGTDSRDRSLDGYRLLSFTDSKKEFYNAIGGGLEIEHLTKQRIGPFELSLYLRGAVTYIVGNLRTDFFQTNPDYPAESVQFHYKNDPWAYQAATGVRLRFGFGD